MKLLVPTKATTKISGRMAQRTFEDTVGNKKQAKRWWKVKFHHNLECRLNLSHMTENYLAEQENAGWSHSGKEGISLHEVLSHKVNQQDACRFHTPTHTLRGVTNTQNARTHKKDTNVISIKIPP